MAVLSETVWVNPQPPSKVPRVTHANELPSVRNMLYLPVPWILRKALVATKVDGDGVVLRGLTGVTALRQYAGHAKQYLRMAQYRRWQAAHR
ncbi:hypothetical protein D3C85_1332760 [compost metagenome]